MAKIQTLPVEDIGYLQVLCLLMIAGLLIFFVQENNKLKKKISRQQYDIDLIKLKLKMPASEEPNEGKHLNEL